MKIINSTNEIRKTLKQYGTKTIGFVPTMGALHEGHISLIKQSIEQNDITIVSIYVNPTQFAKNEDLDNYPNKIDSDTKICSLCGVDIVFTPTFDEIYSKDEVLIQAPLIKGYYLEGLKRPTHFNGMLQVVLKLLNITKPTNAYFGKKDAQQLFLIQLMVKNLFLDTNIVPCDTSRSQNGLALSSRNAYLDTKQLQKALSISKSLKIASQEIANNELNCSTIKANITKNLEILKIDYVEIVNRDFEQIDTIELKNTIILIAAFVDGVRLIDNIWI